MPVFVILSLALAVMAVAVLVLTGIQLVRAVKRLLTAAKAVNDRLAPLTRELQNEIAVTGAEAAALQQTVDAFQRSRQERKRTRETSRQGLRRAARGR